MKEIETLVLDARPLSQIVHPRKFQDITGWFYSAVRAGYRIVIPEVIDCEVRRGLLRIAGHRITVQNIAIWHDRLG